MNQAQQNFDIAKKLTNAKSILTAITKNQKTTTTLATVIDIKTCYGIGQGILTNMTSITDTIQDIQATLESEIKTINENKNSLGTLCYQRLENIANTSKEQTKSLDTQIQKNIKKYTSDFSDKRENP